MTRCRCFAPQNKGKKHYQVSYILKLSLIVRETIFRGLNSTWYAVRAILDDTEMLHTPNLAPEVNLTDEDSPVKHCTWCPLWCCIFCIPTINFLLAVSDLVKRGILCDSEIVNEFCVGRSPLLISYLRILFDYYTATINSRLQEQMYTWLCLFWC